ncbi:unnamed protein product [Adineta steineri]|uniref:Uncharacterized protein n=1 Tax=Adineta steineri TaxID=433720 RepID=A0A814RLL1_9BILA|nr:unnamed protein product [Adineta steineri]CAF4320933.1 unnamed protein product [Adineta steineri]
MEVPLRCESNAYEKDKFADSIEVYNHLIFDFDTHQLAVEQIFDQASPLCDSQCNSDGWVKKRRSSYSQKNYASNYRVNIEKLAKEIRGFNHASMSWLSSAELPTKVDQFSFLHYTYLSHVCLEVTRNDDCVIVLATYGGAVAL